MLSLGGLPPAEKWFDKRLNFRPSPVEECFPSFPTHPARKLRG